MTRPAFLIGGRERTRGGRAGTRKDAKGRERDARGKLFEKSFPRTPFQSFPVKER